eukprot:9492458-Pyramimonas_sp.AAC.1
MHNYDHVHLDGHAWGTIDDDQYERDCSSCEIRVWIRTELDRDAILRGGLKFQSKSKKVNGRALQCRVPRFPQLRPQDRLDPSPGCLDTGQFEEATLPFEACFWRRHFDQKGACLDPVSRRVPIFCEAVGITPQSSLMIDTLHTLYLGVFQRYVAFVVWACISENVYVMSGNAEEVLELTLARLFLDLKQWYHSRGIPKSEQLGQLTSKMVGVKKKQELKTKAAETGTIVSWAAGVAQKHDRLK